MSGRWGKTAAKCLSVFSLLCHYVTWLTQEQLSSAFSLIILAADVTLSSFHVALDLTQPLTASNLSFLISSLHVQLFLLDSPSSLSLCKHLIEFVLNLLSTPFSATKRNRSCSIRRLPLKNTVAHLGSLRANLHGILSIRTLTKKESLVSCSSSPITCLL